MAKYLSFIDLSQQQIVIFFVNLVQKLIIYEEKPQTFCLTNYFVLVTANQKIDFD